MKNIIFLLLISFCIGCKQNINGAYLAHLHFEIRDDINLPIGPEYSNNTQGYLDPTKFINNHRKN